MTYCNESALCDSFMQRCTRYGWSAYPETGDWDILLVRDDIQIGVQAKLRLNVRVLEQCILKGAPNYRRGPHYRAILVPRQKHYPTALLAKLKLLCFSDDNYNHALLREPHGLSRMSNYDWRPIVPEWLPEVIPQVPAGAPAPLQLTKWKQAAMQLFARAEVQGYVTSADIKQLKLSPTVFQRMGWLIPNGEKTGRLQRLVIAPASNHIRPDQQHPQEYLHYLAQARDIDRVLTS
jgi:hypothetical protein